MVDPLETNSYAVAYRLLGHRPAARAVAGIAAERVRQANAGGENDAVEGSASGAHVDAGPGSWLPLLIDCTVDQCVRSEFLEEGGDADDPHGGLREALRRRLARASDEERVVGALVHLSGYDPDSVAEMLRLDVDRVRLLARVLSPPPGVDYRELGDPELIGSPREPAPRCIPIPHWTTIAAVVVLLVLVLLATQLRGPRPTIEEEGSLSAGVLAGHVKADATKADVAKADATKGDATKPDVATEEEARHEDLGQG